MAARREEIINHAKKICAFGAAHAASPFHFLTWHLVHHLQLRHHTHPHQLISKDCLCALFPSMAIKMENIIGSVRWIFALVTLTRVTTAKGSANFVRDCMSSGFDPFQLACSTCNILPQSVRDTCQSCCQSYKTMEKQARRYEAALLIDTGFSSEVQELLNEDYDKIMEKKRGLQVKSVQGGGMFHPEPSSILWFGEIPTGGEDVDLEVLASEVMVLDGLKRGDIREMLLALLPDAAE